MDMRVKIAGVEWNNPVTVASGTFGSGEEYSEFVDLNRLGAVTTKGVANVPWPGNPTPRVAEIHSGMMNAIGLQNPGIDVFCERDIPFLRQFDTKIIVNVCGRSAEDYCEVVERLANEDVDMLEINISCPNVKEGGIAFGQNPKAAEEITRAVKKYAKQPVIMKLSPNVTSISEMAKAVEAGGADAISLINTLTGMKIDINRKTFALANKTGGVSGPAIHPIAVRMVYEAANAVNVPIIGMVQPGAIAAMNATKNKNIGIIGTNATIKSGQYGQYLRKLDPSVTVVTKACPLFVPLVEEGLIDDRITEDMVSRYLREFKQYDIDSLILGCTHYPLLINPIQRFVGDKVTLVNPAYEVAKTLKQMLAQRDMAASEDHTAKYEYYVSDMADQFLSFADKVLPCRVDQVQPVDIENY